MFKHLLLPTDGSTSSQDSMRMALQLLGESKALSGGSFRPRITGLHVIRPFAVFSYGMEMIQDTSAVYEKQSLEHAQQYLEVIERQARTAGVECDTEIAHATHPYEAIIKTAKSRSCDLIVMSSHGRRGVQALLLGSETQKVLTHSDVPVLVLRSK